MAISCPYYVVKHIKQCSSQRESIKTVNTFSKRSHRYKLQTTQRTHRFHRTTLSPIRSTFGLLHRRRANSACRRPPLLLQIPKCRNWRCRLDSPGRKSYVPVPASLPVIDQPTRSQCHLRNGNMSTTPDQQKTFSGINTYAFVSTLSIMNSSGAFLYTQKRTQCHQGTMFRRHWGRRSHLFCSSR